MDYQKQIDEFLQAAARLQYLAAIPLHMHNGLGAYIVHGQAPGTFLSAVIENDLKTACLHADDQNKHCLFHYANFFYNCAPGACWGYKGAIEHWQKTVADDKEVQKKVADLS